MNQELLDAVQEAKQIASSGWRSHEIHSGRWLWCFDLAHLHVVAPFDASPTALAVLIVEQAAIHRAQQATDWAIQALQVAALVNIPPAGGIQ